MGVPDLPCRGGGGGVNPTSMAQNDTHVALIVLTTQMWGGGGGNYWWKKLLQAKIGVPAPLAPTAVLTQNKGPDTEPHFSNPPPPPSAGVHVPPPPPPQSNFQVALGLGVMSACWWRCMHSVCTLCKCCIYLFVYSLRV